MTPSSNRTVTAGCLACGGPLPPSRARSTCSDACRQALWRRRHPPAATPALPAPPAGASRRARTVYQCDNCDTRALGDQRCDDCGTFMRRVGQGGLCPCCDQPVTIDELLNT
jgi:hypothetical protein